jgi:hypothetical protein
MESKNDPIFDKIRSVCGHQRVKDLMGFRHDWNREIIAQFYVTVHYGHVDDERAMLWMTNENKYGILLTDEIRNNLRSASVWTYTFFTTG